MKPTFSLKQSRSNIFLELVVVSENDAFTSNRDLVDEAKDYHLMPERRPHLPAYKTRQRCCTSIAGLIYAVGGLNSAGTVLLLHTVTLAHF